MLGDQSDMVGRMKAVLPQGWFSGNTPVLDAVLAAFGNGFAWVYSLIQEALSAVLINTATSVWLDLHAQDWTGFDIQRRTQELDASFLQRLQSAIFPPGCNRQGVIARVTAVTGSAPAIFEPQQPSDCGAYGYGGLGYNTVGGYGSMKLPFQAFLTAYRPLDVGVPLLAGYNGDQLAPVYAPGGYGSGLVGYTSAGQAFDGPSDDDIYAAVAAAEPAGSIVWTRISAPAS